VREDAERRLLRLVSDDDGGPHRKLPLAEVVARGGREEEDRSGAEDEMPRDPVRWADDQGELDVSDPALVVEVVAALGNRLAEDEGDHRTRDQPPLILPLSVQGPSPYKGKGMTGWNSIESPTSGSPVLMSPSKNCGAFTLKESAQRSLSGLASLLPTSPRFSF